MNNEFFWSIVKSGWSKASTFFELYEFLPELLAGRSASELASYQNSFHALRSNLLRADHLCASYLLEDEYLTIETFQRYVDIIVMSGQTSYNAVSISADNIVDITKLDVFPSFDIEAGMFFDIGMTMLEKFQKNDEYLRISLKIVLEPLDPNYVKYHDLQGFDIVTRRTCEELVPRIYRKYGRCTDDPVRF